MLAVLAVLGGTGYLARFELMRMYEDLPAFTHSAGDLREVLVSMQDGTQLATSIAEPEGEGPWPAILIRNPYDQMTSLMNAMFCGRFVRYGYACVFQSVRGQGESEGEWEPLVNEGRDGRDTLDWLVDQPFQNGQIALVGPSYLAAVQWAIAPDFPPEVKTFVPTVFTTNQHDVLYEDGMFRHETFTAWSAILPRRGMVTDGAGARYQQAIRHRPHIEVDERFFGGRLPWYRSWISSPSPSADLWQLPDNLRMLAAPETLDIPILMIGGWYDVFFGPQMKDWQRLATRSKSRLMVGPWTHIGQPGEALETPDADGGLMQWELLLDWLGHHLKGEALENEPGVSTYVMRENRWVTRPAWPPETHSRELFLNGLTGSGSCDGGRLAGVAPEAEERVSYVYDPDDPVPTRGGSGMLAFVLPDFDGAPAANAWQGALCERSDILSFSTDPMQEPLQIVGTIEVSLSVASSAPDSAFTAKLVEVLPDGRAVNIRDGITSIAYRGNAESPRPYEAGDVVDLKISLWPIEWTVPEGSHLRLDISSSDFPKYHAHPNRFGNWALQDGADSATQTLHAGPGRRSVLSLPVAVKHIASMN